MTMRTLPSQQEYCRIVNAVCFRFCKRVGRLVADCVERTCPIWPVRELKPLPDLWKGTKEDWYQVCRVILRQRFNGSLWFSDLRAAIEQNAREKGFGGPASSHWWGGLGPVLQEEGYEITDVRRKSGTKRRNGAQERMWVKMPTPTTEE